MDPISIEKRLAALEEKERSRTSQDLRLRTDMVEQQKENLAAQKEVFFLRTERQALMDRVAKLELQLKDYKTNLTQPNHVTSTQHDNYDDIDNNCARHHQQMTRQLSELEIKVKQIDVIASDMIHFKNLRQLFNRMVVKDYNEAGSHKQAVHNDGVTNQDLNHRLQGIEDKFDHTETRIDSVIRRWQEDKTNSDRTLQENYDQHVARLQSELYDLDNRIDDIKKWQQDKSDADHTLQENYDKQLATLQDKLKESDSKNEDILQWQQDKTHQFNTFQENYDQQMASFQTKFEDTVDKIDEIQIQRVTKTDEDKTVHENYDHLVASVLTKGERVTTIHSSINRDLARLNNKTLKLHSKENIAFIRSIAQDRKRWQEQTSKIRQAAETSQLEY